jgi:hypothetical protein
MATLTVSLSGSGVVNGNRSFTLSDAAVRKILDWAAVNYATALPQPPDPPATDQQIMAAWVQGWINATRDAVQRHETTAPVVPAPIDVA